MKAKIRTLLSILFISGCFFSQQAFAGLAVVVSPENSANALSKEEVARLFLKKSKKMKDGTKVVPVDQDGDNQARKQFYEKVLNKDQSQVTAYWSRMIFTGKGTPPKVIGNDNDVIQEVRSNRNAIGYIDTDSVDSRVKVLLTVY